MRHFANRFKLFCHDANERTGKFSLSIFNCPLVPTFKQMFTIFFQENLKNIFMMKYTGPSRFPDDFLESIDIKKYECCTDSRLNYVNVFFVTNRQIRPSALKKKIDFYNGARAKENQIIVRAQSQFDDEIMTLSRRDGENLLNNGFYKIILDAKERSDPTYYSWQGVNEEFKKRTLYKQLQIDMVKPFDTMDAPASEPAVIGSSSCAAAPVDQRPRRAKRVSRSLVETDSDIDYMEEEAAVGEGGAPGASTVEQQGRVKKQAHRLQPGDKGYHSLESRMLDCAVTLATRLPVPQGSPVPVSDMPFASIEFAPIAASGALEFSLVPVLPAPPLAPPVVAVELAPPVARQALVLPVEPAPPVAPVAPVAQDPLIAPVAPAAPVAPVEAAAPVAPVALVAQDHSELMGKIYMLEKDNAVLTKTEEMLNIVVEAKNECIHKANECIQQANLRVDAKDQHLRDLMEAKDKIIDILARVNRQ